MKFFLEGFTLSKFSDFASRNSQGELFGSLRRFVVMRFTRVTMLSVRG